MKRLSILLVSAMLALAPAASAEPVTVIKTVQVYKQTVALDSNTWSCIVQGFVGPVRHHPGVVVVITNLGTMVCTWHPLHWYWKPVARWSWSASHS